MVKKTGNELRTGIKQVPSPFRTVGSQFAGSTLGIHLYLVWIWVSLCSGKEDSLLSLEEWGLSLLDAVREGKLLHSK